MNKAWTIWKHALGSFDEEDRYDPKNENYVAVIRTLLVLVNVLVAVLITANILKDW